MYAMKLIILVHVWTEEFNNPVCLLHKIILNIVGTYVHGTYAPCINHPMLKMCVSRGPHL